MFQLMFTILYGAILLFVVVFCGFIVYHLRRYSISPALTTTLMILFLVVTAVLVVVNVGLFIQVPFDTFFSTGPTQF